MRIIIGMRIAVQQTVATVFVSLERVGFELLNFEHKRA